MNRGLACLVSLVVAVMASAANGGALFSTMMGSWLVPQGSQYIEMATGPGSFWRHDFAESDPFQIITFTTASPTVEALSADLRDGVPELVTFDVSGVRSSVPEINWANPVGTVNYTVDGYNY